MAIGSADRTDVTKTVLRGRSERLLFRTCRSRFHLIDGEQAPWACFQKGTFHGEPDS